VVVSIKDKWILLGIFVVMVLYISPMEMFAILVDGIKVYFMGLDFFTIK
jgi:hypothetical protein